MAEKEGSKAGDDRSVLTIRDGVSALQLDDLIDEKFAQLEAAAYMTYADSGESFRSFKDSIQDSFMWMLSRQIAELKALHEAYAAKVGSDLKAARQGVQS